MIPREFAYLFSIAFHVVLALILWIFGTFGDFSRRRAELHEAAVCHAADYQKAASATYADRIKSMNELIARLDREAEAKDAAAQAQDTKADGASMRDAVKTASSAEKSGDKPLSSLWEESREQYNELRKRYLKERAEELSRITGMEEEPAKAEVAKQARDVLGGQEKVPQDQAVTAGQIAVMEAGARKMFDAMMQASSRGNGGVSLSQGASAEAYLLMQNGPGSPEGQSFDEVVDYTPLMISRRPSVNSRLDTPEDMRRIEKGRNRELLALYKKTGNRVRFTRRIGGEGATQRAAWVAPDSWYVIGPFPNDNREQIETRFPPELEIDRDAVYELPGMSPVRWQYVRTRSLGVVPPRMTDFAVYYAYTEINCAEDMDCWLAIGSDDYSKLWVDDLLVWCSSKNEKVWVPSEGFRKVHLHQGVNRFLLRLENGINGCEFSVLICLSDETP
jgi:Skp family chaperone for outer membrane proteins